MARRAGQGSPSMDSVEEEPSEAGLPHGRGLSLARRSFPGMTLPQGNCSSHCSTLQVLFLD